jgi:hypothetical protein
VEEQIVYLHGQSPEAIEAAPVARELLWNRISPGQESLNTQILDDFHRHREDESEMHWQARQIALSACLVRLAAEALLVAYEGDDGHWDEEGMVRFLRTMAEKSVTL